MAHQPSDLGRHAPHPEIRGPSAPTNDPPPTDATPQASEAGAIALPKRSKDQVDAVRQAPVWSTEAAVSANGAAAPEAPLQSKCDKHNRPQTICCRELKGDDERTLIDPDLVRDIIIGLSDGLTVPFSLMAGLASLGSSRLVYIGGMAELISGAISMGVGGYLSAEAERDHFRYQQRTTRERVARSCAGELEREVSSILRPFGVEEPLCRRVAGTLAKVERSFSPAQWPPTAAYSTAVQTHDREPSFLRSIANTIARRPRSDPPSRGVEASASAAGDGGELKFEKDVGISAFLLKFGDGMEEVDDSRLWISAVTIGLSYAIGGLIPLIPYVLISNALHALYVSIGVTAIVLLVFGAFKTYFTGAKVGVRGYLKGSFAMLLVGGMAAAASFGIVRAIEGGGQGDENTAASILAAIRK